MPSPPGVVSEYEKGRKAQGEAAAESREVAAGLGRLEAQLKTVAASQEAQAKTVAGLTDGLTRSERDGLARFKV